jgi:VWFA-related protein
MKTGQLTVASAAAFALAVVTHLAAAPPPSFSGEETVVAVEIPVQVLVDGQPVTGLTKESFEVLEGRKKRPILGFEAVDLRMAETSRGKAVPAIDAEVPAAGRRHFLLLFDLTNSDPIAVARSRTAAEGLVAKDLHPTDLVGVATWSYTHGPRLILGFTSDRKQVDLAIETLGVTDVRNRSADPLGIQLAELTDSSFSSPPTSDARAAKEEAFLENLRQFAANERASARQVARSEVASFTSGASTMAQLMKAVSGRKYVVLLSQGFDSSLVSGSTDEAAQAEMSRAAESGEHWDINSDERFGNTRTANQLEGMLAEFRRADCSIQAVNIGTMATGASAGGTTRASGRDTLATLAKDTGGNLIENFNDLGQAMGKMLTATSVTYVLTIQPDDLKLDGKFHELKVKLVNGPSGARLVHRPGYFAPQPFESRAAIEKQLDSAQLLVAGTPGGDLTAGVAAAAFRGEGDRMLVPVVVEIDGSMLVAVAKSEPLALAIYSYAFDDAGTIVDRVSQNLALDMKQVGDRLKREPLKFVGALRLPAGHYALRTLVRAGTAGAYWLGDSSLDVPAFTPGTLDAVAPLVPTPMTSGVVVRSAEFEEKSKGLAFPFVMGADFYLPAGMPTVRPGGEVKACLNVYGLDNSEVSVKGELVDAEGRAVPDARVAVVSRVASDQPGLQRLELAVKPGSAEAGDYSLRVTVEQTGRSASSSASVRVGS